MLHRAAMQRSYGPGFMEYIRVDNIVQYDRACLSSQSVYTLRLTTLAVTMEIVVMDKLL